MLSVPDGVPPEIAAISACAVITGVGAVLNVVQRAAGQSARRLGAGGVGLAAVMGAALTGAHPVIAIDIDPVKLELARRVGATHVVDAARSDVVERGPRDLRRRGAVDDRSRRPARRRCGRRSRACGPRGTLVAIGLSSSRRHGAVPINELVQRQKRIVGALYGSSNPLIDLPRIFAPLPGRSACPSTS